MKHEINKEKLDLNDKGLTFSYHQLIARYL